MKINEDNLCDLAGRTVEFARVISTKLITKSNSVGDIIRGAPSSVTREYPYGLEIVFTDGSHLLVGLEEVYTGSAWESALDINGEGL